MTALRILVVDDQPEFLSLAEDLFNNDLAHVVATTTDQQHAWQLVREFHANVVLLDIHMPGPSGFAVARDLATRSPDLSVIMVSSVDDPQYKALAYHAGAKGYIPKRDLSPETVVTALQ